MNREEVLKLDGRALDEEVALHLFGAVLVTRFDSGEVAGRTMSLPDGGERPLPRYSADMGAAWEVWQEVRRWYSVDRAKWTAFWNELLAMAEEDRRYMRDDGLRFAEWILQEMRPEHLCRAALLAVWSVVENSRAGGKARGELRSH